MKGDSKFRIVTENDTEPAKEKGLTYTSSKHAMFLSAAGRNPIKGNLELTRIRYLGLLRLSLNISSLVPLSIITRLMMLSSICSKKVKL